MVKKQVYVADTHVQANTKQSGTEYNLRTNHLQFFIALVCTYQLTQWKVLLNALSS
jgi:hypothetical protein